MEQEQKPLPFVITHPKDLSVSDIFNYVNEANAEIERLRDQEQEWSEMVVVLRNRNIKQRQQLADAPTWGEWQDIPDNGLRTFGTGIYEILYKNGATDIVLKNAALDCHYYEFDSGDSDWVKLRRLNYEPQPAREVEKDYFGNTAEEWLKSEGEDEVIGALAKDLLAAQAELRELKGER